MFWKSALQILRSNGAQFCHINIAVIARKLDCNSLGVTSLKRKREERQFVDLRIMLILHSSNEFLKHSLFFALN